MGYVKAHPIVNEEHGRIVSFKFQDRILEGREGEPVTSALVANNIWTFSRHYKDGAPQSLFCANGQCSKCMLLIDGEARKGCVTPLVEGMQVEPLEKLAVPPLQHKDGKYADIEEYRVDALIVGAGPAGLSAAAVLGGAGASVLVIDDKDSVGGKLVLQTHNFFGSVKDCFAGTRGIDIAVKLEKQLGGMKNVGVMTSSVAIGAFADGVVGVVSEGRRYLKVQPRILIVATGARENTLPLEGFDLPGVFGAGAFQTLVNRDMVRCSDRLFIVGGGNVGLIAAYHALQAGMNVVGLCEAMPQFGGYRVHADKIARLGVPLYLKHAAICAHGKEKVESVTIAQVDDKFRPVMGSERSFPVDAILVAVGLNPINELYNQAVEAGITVLTAGDAQEIAEASAAMFSGRLTGADALEKLGLPMPPEMAAEIGGWPQMMEILRARPGKSHELTPPPTNPVYPRLFCTQEIPCDPCRAACPKGSITLSGDCGNILDPPMFEGECTACTRCVAACPGLAITLVDRRKEAEDGYTLVTLPYELPQVPQPGDELPLTDMNGGAIGSGKVIKTADKKWQDRRILITLAVAPALADDVAGVRVQNPEEILHEIKPALLPQKTADDSIVCLCERVTAGEIRRAVREGLRDRNQLKAIRLGMGSCGGGTCGPNVRRILREEGCCDELDMKTRPRPLVFETPLGVFAGDMKDILDEEK